MAKQNKEKFDVGKSLPNMLDEANKKPDLKGRPLPAGKIRRFSWKKAILSFFLVLLVLFVASVGWVSYKFEKDCSKVFKGCTIFSLFDNSPLKGEDTGRVNILLAGNSTDDPGHEGAKLTDSIMLVSINTRNHTGYMLSIPRDLYVNYGTTDCPYGDAGKINAVYECGEYLKFREAGYPHGGMGLLEKIVSQDFGAPINYYALVDYSAFRDMVNAVGGITITIKSSDPRGVYDPYTHLKLPNGKVKLDGQTALNLARSRGDGPGSYGVFSDFDRTSRQREMLTAVKDKATSLGSLVNPLKLGSLLDAMGKNVTTDFQGNNIHRAASIIKNVPDSKLKSVGLNNIDGKGKNLLSSTYLSGSTLSPAAGVYDFSQIQNYIQELNQR
ncbi:MAG TPA: LCP family protein [Candidatus Saccharimonadales bacterium]|nr:LCP family protein [Candidatus Saccharimonadales bacterium]